MSCVKFEMKIDGGGTFSESGKNPGVRGIVGLSSRVFEGVSEQLWDFLFTNQAGQYLGICHYILHLVVTGVSEQI